MKNIASGKKGKELDELLKEKRKALLDFSNEVFQGKAKNVKEGRNIRKQIAQIKTVMTMNAKNNEK